MNQRQQATVTTTTTPDEIADTLPEGVVYVDHGNGYIIVNALTDPQPRVERPEAVIVLKEAEPTPKGKTKTGAKK